MTTTIPHGNDLVGMGGRYWYAMVAKLSQAWIRRYIEGERGASLDADADALARLLRQGPWKKVDEEARRLFDQVFPASQPVVAADTFVAVRPENIRQRGEELRAELLAAYPALEGFPHAVDAWVRNHARLSYLEECLDANPPVKSNGDSWPIEAHIARLKKTAFALSRDLGLTPRAAQEIADNWAAVQACAMTVTELSADDDA